MVSSRTGRYYIELKGTLVTSQERFKLDPLCKADNVQQIIDAVLCEIKRSVLCPLRTTSSETLKKHNLKCQRLQEGPGLFITPQHTNETAVGVVVEQVHCVDRTSYRWRSAKCTGFRDAESKGTYCTHCENARTEFYRSHRSPSKSSPRTKRMAQDGPFTDQKKSLDSELDEADLILGCKSLLMENSIFSLYLRNLIRNRMQCWMLIIAPT